MKKVLLSLAALLFATASAQPTELSFQHAMSGPLGEAVTAMVEKYNAEQSDVVVNEKFIGSYDQALQKILAQLAGETSPDIAQLEVALVARVAESGTCSTWLRVCKESVTTSTTTSGPSSASRFSARTTIFTRFPSTTRIPSCTITPSF